MISYTRLRRWVSCAVMLGSLLGATPTFAQGTATATCSPATAVTSTTAVLRGEINSVGAAAPTVTFFWGTTDGGIVAGGWQNNLPLAGTWTGPFSVQIGGLTANTNYHFTVRTTNSAGESWATPSTEFETLPMPPSVTTGAASGIGSSSATLGATVTSTGGEPPTVTIYYGTTDGGTSMGNWLGSKALGNVSDSGSAIVTDLNPATRYYFRAFARNSGGDTWAGNTGEFTTLTTSPASIVNLPAAGVTGTTATLRGEVTATGNAAPDVTLFYGATDGGTTPGAWQFTAGMGTQTGEFSRFVSGLTPGTKFYFRSRAVNPAGTSWAPQTEYFFTTAAINSTPVINEIHYHPADDVVQGPLPLEFIELTNPGDTTIDLAGWKLADAVTFTFPAGTTLAPGGYVVVAQDPAILLSKYGKSALGPWVGKLSNSGETIELRDAGNALKDTVSYQSGFPWPTTADGEGPSIELLNPALDNDLSGSWRSSGGVGTPAATYIAPSATGWKYAKGTGEASAPVTAWRNLGFNDSAWLTGQTPIGYGFTVSCNTVLTDMRGTSASNYSTVYARKSFTLPVGQIPDTLTLSVRFDDGCVAWINGTEVYRGNLPGGQLAYTAVANGSVGTASWTTVNLTGTSAYLFGGSNVLTIQAVNVSKNGSSDFNIDAELGIPATGNSTNPTPGSANAAKRAVNLIPPQIRQVQHTPTQPAAGQAVAVTARITDPDGMGTVSLAYQIVNPGSYIRRTDAQYDSSWTSTPMIDNGTNGDAVAGDSIFTAMIPASVQTHRRLIRYKISFADSQGNAGAAPYADDEQPNFAYFVYNGVPNWTGALRPTSFAGFPATSAATYPVSTLSGMATYHLIADATDVNNCQYVASFNGVRFFGTFVYDGVVYDHIQFKNRGIGSTYQSGKNKWNIFFNRARDLQARDNWGKKYGESWNNLLLNANSSPWAPINRGSAGIEEASSARIFELAGNTNFRTHYVHWRIIDDAVETSPTSQYDGDLWGLYLAIEPTEGNFIGERGLADGNVYAIEGNNGDKKHQAEGQPLDSSDWNSFRNNLAAGGQTEAWYRANMDLDKLYTFIAINRLIGNVDVRPGDNYRYFHRSSDNKWEILGYDLDMMYIAAHHWGGTMDGVMVAGQPNSLMAIMRHPALAREYRNRCREIMDLLASDGTANGGQVGQLLDEYARMVHPTGQTLTWANLDAALWNLNPKSKGNGGNSGQGEHKGNFFRSTYFDSRGAGGVISTGSWVRTLADPDGDGFSDFPGRVKWFVDFATNTYPAGAAPWIRKASNAGGSGNDSDVNRQKGYGYKYLEWESLYGGWADSKNEPTTAANVDFPGKPVLTAAGNPAFPVNGLTFAPSSFTDPQGTGTFAAWQWRVAEISAPGTPGFLAGQPSKYEIQALATSAELTTAPAAFTLPAGLVSVGKTYRVRSRQKDTTGNWSHWSEPVQFTASPSVATLVHYWNFNNSGTLLTPTATSGGASMAVAGTFLADTGQGFFGENARNGDSASSHLRLNNPLTLGTQITALLPTTGFQNILVSYETRRSGQGAGTQSISYSVDGSNFLPFTTFTIADDTPAVKFLDFKNVAGVNDNPLFSVRITFSQGAGGTGGNNRFDGWVVEGEPLPGPPVLLPGGDASWNLASNWSSGAIPDGVAAAARIDPPSTAARVVTVNSGITLGTLQLEQGNTSSLNKIDASGSVGITFDGGASSALLHAGGTGTGYADLEIKGGTTLHSDLRISANNIEGDASYGALRLREAWSGPGGLIKQGAGLIALTGSGKSFTGRLTIEQGVVQLTQPAVPGSTSGVTVLAGGQLKLFSGDEGVGPRVHTFGGTLTLAGSGRGNAVPTGGHYGMLGALRYDPEPGGTNAAVVTNPIIFSADADIHTDGPDNSLTLSGTLTGPGSLTKSGGGALVLSGNSPTFAGPLVISNGPLEVNANMATAPVQISAGSTLRGAGRVGTISGSGAVAPIASTLTAPTTAAADYDFGFSQPGLSGNSALQLTGPSPFAALPATLDLFVDPAGRVPGDRLLGGFFTAGSYDLAAALSATQVRLLVADPAGTLAYAGTNYRISVSSDSLVWSVETRTVDFGNGPTTGKILEISVTGAPTAFAQWRNLWFQDGAATDDAISGPNANPAGDGVTNLMRYALGIGPDDAAVSLLPVLVKSGNAREFRFRYDASKSDLTWRVEATTQPAGWTNVLFNSQTSAIPPMDQGWLAVPIPTYLGAGPAPDPTMFVRLVVVRTSP